jgi:helix-turn-helix, Psq domain
MKLWTEVRLDVRSGKLSMREACKKYKLNFRTFQKILNHEEPPGYRNTGKRSKPVLGAFGLFRSRD